MMKQLSIVAALVFAIGCKTDAPSSAKSTPAGDDPTAKSRSGKIDIKPVKPALPSTAAPTAPSLPAEDPPRADDSPRAADAPDSKDLRRRRNAAVDTNGDGVITPEEREAAMQTRATGMHTRLDSDGDGKLTPAEMANARGRMRFDNPSELDTNHDGDISADELAAGLKARRAQRRDAAGSAAGSADEINP
jgi:hypothetical protein